MSVTQTVRDMVDLHYSERPNLQECEDYYYARATPRSLGVAVPPELRHLSTKVGWSRMYCDAIIERTLLEYFRIGDKSGETANQWWTHNKLPTRSNMGHLDSLIYGRSYVTVSDRDDDSGIPLINVESPMNMSHSIDPRTGDTVRAIRVYDLGGSRLGVTLLDREDRVLLEQSKGSRTWKVIESHRHGLGEVPVKVLLNRESLATRQGESEITPEIRSFSDAASRLMMDMAVAAELIAVPQRVLTGVDPQDLAPGGNPSEILDAYMARILAIANDSARVFQFTAAELRNFVDGLEQLAKHVASYTGLPPQYLTFSSDNPASSEAIKASEVRLVKKCERKAGPWGVVWVDAMRLADRVVNGREDFTDLEAVWRDPATPTYASKADAVTKMYANGAGLLPLEQAWIDMGYSDVQRELMRKMREEEPAVMLSQMLRTDRQQNPGQAPPTNKKPVAE